MMNSLQEIEKQQVILAALLKENGASLVGFGDVSIVDSELADKFPTAISIVVRLDERIVDNLHIDEGAFRHHLDESRSARHRLMDIAADLLDGWGYNYIKIPTGKPITSNEELSHLQVFPHKVAATCAGLGWIGKNCLLVTPECGPRVGLATVLTYASFKTAEPVIESRCGNCRLCVDACPYQAIKGIEWQRGVNREEMFDPYICNQKRLDFIPLIGRKHAGGYCIQACPVGRGADRNASK